MTQALTAAVSQPRQTREERSTQRSRALTMLREHPAGVCITEVARWHPYDVLTFRNRIGELRRDGYPIISRPCREHQHQGMVARYSLTGAPQQLELGA